MPASLLSTAAASGCGADDERSQNICVDMHTSSAAIASMCSVYEASVSSHPTRKLSSASTNRRPSSGFAALAPSDDAGSSRCGSRSCVRSANAVLADMATRALACVRAYGACARLVGRRGARLCLERLHHVPEDDGDKHDGAASTLELRLSDWLGLRQIQVIQRADQERLKVAGRSVVA